MGIFSFVPMSRSKKDVVGEGISGKVEQCSMGKSLYVIKTYHDREPYETRKDYKNRVLHEFRILCQLDHTNIIKVYRSKISLDGLRVKIYMEAGSSNLLDIIRHRKDKLNSSEVFHLWHQVCSGVGYMHERGFCHRDLKLENLVMDQSLATVKIIDFMSATRCDGPAVGIVGSPHYMAPEMASKISYDGKMADIWSLGIILYYLTNNNYPWRQAIHSDPEFIAYVAQKGFASSVRKTDYMKDSSQRGVMPSVPRLSHSICSMLQYVLAVEPQDRYDIVQVLADKTMNLEDGQNTVTQSVNDSLQILNPASSLMK